MKISETRSRWRVGAATIAVLAGYCAGIYIAFLWLPAWITASLRLPIAVFVLQVAVLTILAGGICLVKVMRQIQQVRASKLHELIQGVMAVHAAGDLSRLKLESRWMDQPDDLAPHLEVMLLTTRGEARQRLSRLTSEIGLTAHWVRESRSSNAVRRGAAVRRLGLIEGYTILDRLNDMIFDSDPAVRVGVYRALLKPGLRAEDAEQVFNAVADESLLIRALVNNELGKHAAVLCVRALPDALMTSDQERVMRLLDMIGAWRRMITVPGLRELLLTLNPGIQQRVLALLPYLTEEADTDDRARMQTAKHAAVLSWLEPGDEQVMVAAAAASGRLQMESAIPLLVSGLKGGTYRIIRSSAEALAQLGPRGVGVLELEMLTSSRPSASAALEALERARPGQRQGAI